MQDRRWELECPGCRKRVAGVAIAGVGIVCPLCRYLIATENKQEVVRLTNGQNAIAQVRLAPGDTPPPIRPRMEAALVPFDGQRIVESMALQSQAKSRRIHALTFGLLALAAVAGGAALIHERGEDLRSVSKPGVIDPVADAPPKAAPVKQPAVVVAQDPQAPPAEMDVDAKIMESAEVLAEFFKAADLETRLALVEMETPPEELAAGFFAGPIEASFHFQEHEVKFDRLDGTLEIIFLAHVTPVGGDEETHLLMVRTREEQSPKVVADAFLDTFGGRLEAFAAEPVPGIGTFRTTAAYFDFCRTDDVPNPGKKQTFKLLRAPGGSDLAKAYFSVDSGMNMKLRRLGMKTGLPAVVTLQLRWNTGEDPEQPFLELVDVLGLNWD